MRTVLKIFAKAPVAGQVKTRLAPALGHGGAVRLHRRLTEHAVATACAAGCDAVELWCSPDPGHPFFAAHGVALRTQRGDDLGARMLDALAAGGGGEAGVVIGTDCPGLTPGHLARAAGLVAAGEADVVLGPAADGGYVLIAMAEPLPGLFAAMAWGTPAVLGATRRRLRNLGRRVTELEVLHDVDRPADLRWLPPAWGYRQPGSPDGGRGS